MDHTGRPRSGKGELIMGPIEEVTEAIAEHLRMTNGHRDQIMVVMGPELYEKMVEQVDSMFTKKIGKKYKSVAGVDIVVKDRIPGEAFGIMRKSCLEHIEEHIDELLELVDKERPDWIQCDLCKHPINTILADGDDLICPWCGDMNDLEDIRNGEY